MQKTTYYELNKPETTDTYNIANENDNMDIIDTQLHTNAENISTLNENKLAKTGDSKDTTTTFTSSDVADGSATAWTSVTKLDSGEKHSSIFAKVSQMFKNVRYLYKLLGTTDVSSFFGGSGQDITGALSTLNNHIGSHTVAKNVPSDAVFTDHTYNGSNLNTSTSKTGSGTTVTDTIASGTSMNSAIGTLLNNDAALNSALSNKADKSNTVIGTGDKVLKIAYKELSFNYEMSFAGDTYGVLHNDVSNLVGGGTVIGGIIEVSGFAIEYGYIYGGKLYAHNRSTTVQTIAANAKFKTTLFYY